MEASPIASEPIVALDWRHAQPSRPPSTPHRLRRSLRRREAPNRAASWLRAKMRRIATRDLEREAPSSFPEPDGSAAACDQSDVSRGPVLELRHGYPDATAARSPRARISEGAITALRRGRGASVAALTLAAVATAAVAIASAVGGAGTKPRRSAVVASASAHAFASAAAAPGAAMGIVEHHFRIQASRSDGAPASGGRRVTRHHSRPANRQSTTRPSAAAATTSPAPSAASYHGSSPTPAYGGSSSPSGYGGSSSPPSTPTAHPAAHKQTTQPAFGANGSLAPGRGASGTQ